MLGWNLKSYLFTVSVYLCVYVCVYVHVYVCVCVYNLLKLIQGDILVRMCGSHINLRFLLYTQHYLNFGTLFEIIIN